LAVLLGLTLTEQAEASGTVHRVVVPADAKAGTAGYTMEVDTRWTDLGGYRPVRISITPHQPASIDTHFSFQFRVTSPNFYFYGRENRGTTLVEQTVVVPSAPEGSTPPATRATLSVPEHHAWDRFGLDVWENDEYRPKLSFQNMHIGGGMGQRFSFRPGNASVNTTVLRVDSQTSLPNPFPNFGFNGGPMQANSVSINPSELPERWTDLTSVDVVSMKLDELKKLVEKNPQKWRAVRAWVAAGGNLWVTDVAKAEHDPRVLNQVPIRIQWQHMTELERLLDVPPHERNAAAWNNRDLLRERKLQMGQVVALPTNFGNNPRWFSGNNDGLERTAASIGATRLQWEQRTGVLLDAGNADFWDFIIPGVGQVPVTAFQVLITLFVVAIGPLNYVYLKRRGKLHLLMITVPLCALLVTFSLFGYALATDGLGVRVRVRSYSEIDQRRGEAVCWSRLCYYAGLAPSQGLRFSGETVVLPIDPKIDDPAGGLTRQLSWTDDGEQHLKEGWLRSRNLTQYLTLRARRSQVRLAIKVDPSGGLQVENQLGTNIQELVVCDAEGKQFAAKELAAGQQTVLNEGANLDDAYQRMSRAFEDQKLGPPPGLDGYDLLRGSYRYGYYPSMPRGQGGEEDRLEGSLSDVKNLLMQRKLAPRTYLAIVDQSPEVELGTPSARQEASFHVILGHW
jgi:hypothetical protein